MSLAVSLHVIVGRVSLVVGLMSLTACDSDVPPYRCGAPAQSNPGLTVEALCGSIFLRAGTSGSSAAGSGAASQASAGAQALPESVPSDWIGVHTDCHFDFKAPPDVSKIAVQGTDSCVVQYRTAECKLLGDYGAYSDPLSSYSEQIDYQEQAVVIDARTGKLVSYQSTESKAYVAALHIPDVGSGPGIKLTLMAECTSSEAIQRTARTLLETVKFND